MTSLAGRRVVVTGGTAGIGLATARHLAAIDAVPFITARSEDRLEAVTAELGIGGRASDVSDFAHCESLMEAAALSMGGIDAIVNSAGVGRYAPISSLAVADWQDMMDINVTGTFNTCKAALPYLKNAERADIINLGSRVGRYAFAGGTGYCATKFAIQGFSEALFLDVVEDGIGVSLIAPGTVSTEFAGATPEDWHIHPDDVAEAIALCLSSPARTNINWVELRPSRRSQARK